LKEAHKEARKTAKSQQCKYRRNTKTNIDKIDSLVPNSYLLSQLFADKIFTTKIRHRISKVLRSRTARNSKTLVGNAKIEERGKKKENLLENLLQRTFESQRKRNLKSDPNDGKVNMTSFKTFGKQKSRNFKLS